MLESLRKDKHWIEYPFGTIFYGRLVRYLKDRDIHPNWYTTGFIILGVFSGIFIANNYILISYIFWRLSIILDLVDGPIARYKNKTSKLGEYLDNIGHVLCGLFLTIGAVWGAFRTDRMLVAISAAFMFLMVYTFKYIYYTVFRERKKIRLSKNKTLIFLEKRCSDFFDIEMLFLLPFFPMEGLCLFIGVKFVRVSLIIHNSIMAAKNYEE